jgi:hypothetical protein
VLVQIRDAFDEAPIILRELIADGIDVYECRPIVPTLESLFLDAVRSVG